VLSLAFAGCVGNHRAIIDDRDNPNADGGKGKEAKRNHDCVEHHSVSVMTTELLKSIPGVLTAGAVGIDAAIRFDDLPEIECEAILE
jgi:hypothetical protein